MFAGTARLLKKAQRRLWMKYALRGVGGSDNHSRLDLAYNVEDPWNMDSALEQARFQATNRIVEENFGCWRSAAAKATRHSIWHA